MQKIGEVVAERVKRYRTQRGWTQEQLAEQMDELGYPINRVTLAKLEAGGGRANNLQVTELLILAAALDVPPALLFIPLGSNEELEVTPKVQLHPYLVFKWLAGDEPFCVPVDGIPYAKNVADWKRASEPITFLRGFDDMKNSIREAQRLLAAAERNGDDATASRAQSMLDDRLLLLDRQRGWMEDYGMEVPEVLPEWEDRMLELRAEAAGMNVKEQ